MMSPKLWLMIAILITGTYFFDDYFWLALAIVVAIAFVSFVALAVSMDGTEGQDLDYDRREDD